MSITFYNNSFVTYQNSTFLGLGLNSYLNLIGENYWSSNLLHFYHTVSLDNLEDSSGLVEIYS